MSNHLCIDASMGMAGDMFCAALIALGAPADHVLGAMTRAGELLGRASVRPETVEQDGLSGIRLRVELVADIGCLFNPTASRLVDNCLQRLV